MTSIQSMDTLYKNFEHDTGIYTLSKYPAVDLVRELASSVVEHINPAVAHSENCGLSWRMVGEPGITVGLPWENLGKYSGIASHPHHRNLTKTPQKR